MMLKIAFNNLLKKSFLMSFNANAYCYIFSNQNVVKESFKETIIKKIIRNLLTDFIH